MNEQVFGGLSQQTARARAAGLAGHDARLRARCPHCGEGRLFRSFLKTVDRCAGCGEVLHHHRADDLPAYLVVVLVGHLVVGASWASRADSQSVHLAASGDLGTADHRPGAGLLRPVKGAVVGLQWALYMHGFGGDEDTFEAHPEL